MKDLNHRVIREHEINQVQRKDLLKLLQDCFPGYFKDRIYFKQTPIERYLVYKESELIAQMALEYRTICVGDRPHTIIGVVDLCVKEEHRNNGIGLWLLKEVDNIGLTYGIDYALLFADEHSLYLKNQYELVSNDCVWFGIEEHKSLGLINGKLDDCMMIKKLSADTDWNNTLNVDLLGYLF